MNKRLNILIIQIAFLGDVILSTALIEKIKQKHPNAKIDFLLRKGNENLLNNNPNVNNVLILDKKNKFYSIYNILKIIRKNKYDKLVNVHRYFTAGFISVFSGAKEKIGFNKNIFSFLFDIKIKHSFNNIHEIERNQMLIEHFTDKYYSLPKIYPSLKDIEKVNQYLDKKYITISAGSLWKTKKYPIEKWIIFLNKIEKNIDVFLLGSINEIEEANYIIKESNNKNIYNFCGNFNLIQSAVLMKSAIMNYANDSAPTHIASAINAPITTIFCSTSSKYGYGPVSKISYIVKCEEKLDCQPCTNHGKKECPLKHFNCGNFIKTEQLLNTMNLI